MNAKPFAVQNAQLNWVEASPKAAADVYASSAGQKPDVRHMRSQADAELAAHGVRRVDNRTPAADRFQLAVLVAITASGDRATAQWSITDGPLAPSQARLAASITEKYLEVASLGVVMAVADGNGNDFRFMTDEASERRYTVAATALSLTKPWDPAARWLCFRSTNGNMRRLSLTEAEFRALYFAITDHYAAANKRHDKLQRDVENATDVPDLRVIEANIENGWPS